MSPVGRNPRPSPALLKGETEGSLPMSTQPEKPQNSDAPAEKTEEERRRQEQEAALDEALRESFPASDPPEQTSRFTADPK